MSVGFQKFGMCEVSELGVGPQNSIVCISDNLNLS